MILPILTVWDVDASVDFYVNKLGFTKDMVMAGPDGKNTFGFVRLGKAIIGLDAMTPAQQKAHPARILWFMFPTKPTSTSITLR